MQLKKGNYKKVYKAQSLKMTGRIRMPVMITHK